MYQIMLRKDGVKMGRVKVKDQNYLEQIPVRNPEFPWKENDEGIVTVDMVHRGFFAALARKLWVTPKVSHIKLDRFGSFVWKQIDGNRDLIEIGTLVKSEFGDKAEPLYERLAKYFDMLKNNKFISFKK